MATTSIWRVKGWLGKVVIYVENPDKTENPAFYEKQEMTERQAQGLSDVIDYAVNSEKTQTTGEATEVMQQFISGVNCHPSTAREEMIAVKKRFGKEDGTVAYHGYQSFAPGEATPEMAHEIGVKLAQQLWGDKYQVIVATHLDKDSHLHNHFVVNTVSFLDGLKYHRTEKDYYEMQKASDALCREYGLSVIENPQRGKSKQYGEWRAEQEDRPTWRGLIRAEIDEVIRQSMTERQFFDNLRKRGYEVKVGKDISVRPPGKERFVRLERNFGEDYSLEGIHRRILMQQRSERPLPEPEHIFSGLLKCADCGKALSRRKYGSNSSHMIYVCGTYATYGSHKCTQHKIFEEDLTAAMLADIQELFSAVKKDKAKLIDLLIKNKAKNEGKALNTKDAQYKRVCKRLDEVNRLVDKLYEDNISGKINETNFVRLLSKYQQEQESILAEKGKLESETAAVREIRSDAEQFADLLERYGDITELTPEILNMLVDKIMVYEPRAVDGVMRQQIDVYYRYIGVVKLVDYGSTTYYKSGEVLTAAKKRENAKMEKRIAAVKEEMQSDEAVSA